MMVQLSFDLEAYAFQAEILPEHSKDPATNAKIDSFFIPFDEVRIKFIIIYNL